MADTAIKERVQHKLQKFQDIADPEEAQAEVITLPLVAVHEARYAIQMLKDKYGSDEDLLEIVEPLSRVVGWVEASTYFLDITTQREALKTMFSGGQIPAFQGPGNNS